MSKLLESILSGRSDANISFRELCRLLRNPGFEERVRGSHHIFRKSGVEERPNLQQDGTKAKTYQVQQIRKIILKHNLEVTDD